MTHANKLGGIVWKHRQADDVCRDKMNMRIPACIDVHESGGVNAATTDMHEHLSPG
jgi:hypothetical protein